MAKNISKDGFNGRLPLLTDVKDVNLKAISIFKGAWPHAESTDFNLLLTRLFKEITLDYLGHAV